MPTARVYARVSHVDSLEGFSIEQQMKDCWTYYKTRLESTGCVAGDHYVDRAVSAFNVPFIKRREGYKIIQDSQKGDHIIFLTMDRAFRSLKDCVKTFEIFENRGITIHFAKDTIDPSTPDGKAMMYVWAIFAERESRIKSMRIKECLALKKRRNPLAPYRPSRCSIPGLKPIKRNPRAAKLLVGYWELDPPMFEVYKEMLIWASKIGKNGHHLYTWPEILEFCEKKYCEVYGYDYRTGAFRVRKLKWSTARCLKYWNNRGRNNAILKEFYGDFPEAHLCPGETDSELEQWIREYKTPTM